jgi:hypothetical protein
MFVQDFCIQIVSNNTQKSRVIQIHRNLNRAVHSVAKFLFLGEALISYHQPGDMQW